MGRPGGRRQHLLWVCAGRRRRLGGISRSTVASAWPRRPPRLFRTDAVTSSTDSSRAHQQLTDIFPTVVGPRSTAPSRGRRIVGELEWFHRRARAADLSAIHGRWHRTGGGHPSLRPDHPRFCSTGPYPAILQSHQAHLSRRGDRTVGAAGSCRHGAERLRPNLSGRGLRHPTIASQRWYPHGFEPDLLSDGHRRGGAPRIDIRALRRNACLVYPAGPPILHRTTSS